MDGRLGALVPASSLFLRQDPAGSHTSCQTALVPEVCLKLGYLAAEIPAVLAILPGNQSDLALSSALGTLEAVVVAGLDRAAEESATRRTNLIQSVGLV